jgi:hypothetical protein
MDKRTVAQRIVDKVNHKIRTPVREELRVPVLRKSNGSGTKVVHAEASGANQSAV